MRKLPTSPWAMPLTDESWNWSWVTVTGLPVLLMILNAKSSPARTQLTPASLLDSWPAVWSARVRVGT